MDTMEGESDSDEEVFRELQDFFKRDEKRLAEVIAH